MSYASFPVVKSLPQKINWNFRDLRSEYLKKSSVPDMGHHRSNYFSCGNADRANELKQDRMVDYRNRMASDYLRSRWNYRYLILEVSLSDERKP